MSEQAKIQALHGNTVEKRFTEDYPSQPEHHNRRKHNTNEDNPTKNRFKATKDRLCIPKTRHHQTLPIRPLTFLSSQTALPTTPSLPLPHLHHPHPKSLTQPTSPLNTPSKTKPKPHHPKTLRSVMHITLATTTAPFFIRSHPLTCF